MLHLFWVLGLGATCSDAQVASISSPIQPGRAVGAIASFAGGLWRLLPKTKTKIFPNTVANFDVLLRGPLVQIRHRSSPCPGSL